MEQQLWWSGQNCIPCTQRNILAKMNFFPKNIILNLFSDFGQEIPEFLGNFSPRVSKPYYTRQRTLLNKFRNNFSQEFWRKHWSGLKKLQVCQESFLPLQGNNFLGETKLCKLSGSDWKLNGCLWKNRWQICQKRIPGDKKIFLRKMKFLSKEKIGLEFIIRQGCQTWNLRAQRPFWKKFRDESSINILSLEFFAKNLNWTHKLRVGQEGIQLVLRNISRNIFTEKPKFRAPSEKIPIFGE